MMVLIVLLPLFLSSKVFALETTNGAKNLFDLDLKAEDKVALVMGNEVMCALLYDFWKRIDTPPPPPPPPPPLPPSITPPSLIWLFGKW